MATNTYVELATITPSGSLTSIVLNSIPSTYTDLILVGQYSKSAANSVRLWLNNDTSSGLYSQTIVYGNGTTASSGRESNENAFYMMDYLSASTSSTHTTITHIQNYANTNIFKTIFERGGSGAVGVTAAVGTWRNTNAITRIDVGAGSGTFTAGTTFSLYGVKAWTPEVTPKATGGYVYEDSTYWYHAFPFSSTFTPNQSLTADVLVVAGGGGGGNGNGGGGGGAGGVLGLTSQSLTATNYTVTIGAGGAMSTDGASSSFASSIALKGGRGGDAAQNGTGGSGTYGSGGGCGRDGGTTGGAGTSGQGFAGGNSAYPTPTANGGSGGGGAGGTGKNVVASDNENQTSPNGDGGVGVNTYASWLSATRFGVDGYIAGGGGGSGYQVFRAPAGGLGGGGRGTMREYGALGATAGVQNTGSGGGGGGTGAFKSNGMPGGSGLVIVRYAK